MKDDTSHVIAVINALSDSENQRYSVLVYWSSKFKSSRDLRSDSHKHPEKEFKISICFRNSNLEGGIEVRNSSIQFDEDWCLTLHQSHIGCNPPEDFETVFFGLSKGVIVYVKHGCKLGNLPRKKTGAPKIHFSQSHWYFDTRESELLMSCLDSRIWENPFESNYYEYVCCIIRIMIPIRCLHWFTWHQIKVSTTSSKLSPQKSIEKKTNRRTSGS